MTDVNPKQGSTVGGTELTIEGRGFYNETFAEAKVRVVVAVFKVNYIGIRLLNVKR